MYQFGCHSDIIKYVVKEGRVVHSVIPKPDCERMGRDKTSGISHARNFGTNRIFLLYFL